MKVRRIFVFALMAALPWAIGCTSSRNATTTSSSSGNTGFFGRLCGKKDHSQPKQAQGCMPQWGQQDQQHAYQAPVYQGSAMYMEGPSISMGGSCNPCGSSTTILPGSSLPCSPGAPGVYSPGAPGVANPPPSTTNPPKAQPVPANPTKLIQGN